MNLTEKDNFFDLLSLWLRQHALVSSGMGRRSALESPDEADNQLCGRRDKCFGGFGEAKMNVRL